MPSKTDIAELRNAAVAARRVIKRELAVIIECASAIDPHTEKPVPGTLDELAARAVKEHTALIGRLDKAIARFQ